MSVLAPTARPRFGRGIAPLLRHRELAWEMTRREIRDRYAGQALGALWAVGHPVIFMAVYLFLFAFVFGARIEQQGRDAPADYAIYLLCGLLPWLTFQEVMGRSSTVIVANANLVKQVVFPVEILPVKVVLASCLTQILFMVLLLLFILARAGSLGWTCLLLPPLMLLQVVAMAGAGYGLAAVGCYFRDIKEVVTAFGLVNLYLMPTVYLPEWVPAFARPILYANPFSYMTWCYQDALFYGELRHPLAWVLFPLLALALLAAGERVFSRLKPHFGNVL